MRQRSRSGWGAFIKKGMSGPEQSGEVDEQRQKFLVELEFVQCLANPHYIDWLGTQVRNK